MSHIPPPNYYAGVPAPPSSGGYAYVPVPVATPVMMPVYQPSPHHHPQPSHHPQQPHHPQLPHQPYSHYPPPPTAAEGTQQPTYVTNYIYQQTPQTEPVTFVEAELLDWVPATPVTAAQLSHRAFEAGKEGWDGSPLWVIRAHFKGDLVPGKLAVKHRSAYIPHGGKELSVHQFEVLCAPQHSLRWVPASNGQVPAGAIPAGNTQDGEPLYIARCDHKNSTTPGKVHPSHGTAYISFGGSEVPFRSYKVLCKFVG